MKKFSVMFHTRSNFNVQFMTVFAENKGEAKSIVREKLSEQVYFLNVIEVQ